MFVLSSDMLKVTLVRSIIGALPSQKKIIKALGLKKTGRFVFQKNNSAINGMINKISHMVKVETV